ncbi:hypothetical protein GF312_04965 [Candidatus Poribacteria bacterium]|nr:hypothetical protein [Candidatus Poribacteria bacterium]
MEKLYIIDAIGAFFQRKSNKVTNWSKINFHELETDNKVDNSLFKKIEVDFRKFIQQVSEIGYNAISIDDIAHLVDFDNYPYWLKDKISTYQGWYERLFAVAREYGFNIFVNTDVMFYNEFIDAKTGGSRSQAVKLLVSAVAKYVLKTVFRIGCEYGTTDKILMSKSISRLCRFFISMYRDELPEFINSKAMGIELLFT